MWTRRSSPSSPAASYAETYAHDSLLSRLAALSGVARDQIHIAVEDECNTPVNSTLRQVFPSVKAYNQAVYSFMDEWGWNMAYVDPGMELLEPEQVDQRIAERITGGADALRFLDGESYRGLFCLSKAHRKTLGEEKRVLSRERGTFALMHSQGLCVAGSSGNGSAH